MTKRAFFRRRTNGPNNDHVFGLRSFFNTFKRRPMEPLNRGSLNPNLPGETNRQFAIRRLAEQRAVAALDAKTQPIDTVAEKPKRVRPSRAKAAVFVNDTEKPKRVRPSRAKVVA